MTRNVGLYGCVDRFRKRLTTQQLKPIAPNSIALGSEAADKPIRKSGVFPGVTDKQVILKCWV
jgi:hypothetical protein